jgi:integrase
MGAIYRRTLRPNGGAADGNEPRRSSIWWLKYYAHGRCIRESSATDNKRAAERLLKEREGRVATGQPILPRADKVTYQEIRDDLRRFYDHPGGRNLIEVDKRLAHLDPFFRGWRVVTIDRSAILRYRHARLAARAANGTINRELSLLGTMLRQAVQANKLFRLPDLRKIQLPEAEPRAGFFEEDQFEWVKKRLPEDLQAAVSVDYAYGWRTQSEILALQRRHLDLAAGTLTLDASMTKNRKPRMVYLTPELKTQLAAQVERVKALERQLGRVIPWLFPHLPHPHVDPQLVGTPRSDFRRAWLTACKRAGVPGKLRHDFRRTAARNLIRRGVPEVVAMRITGHRTRSIFDRYNIVSTEDLQDAARRLGGAPTAGAHDAPRGHTFGHTTLSPDV